MSTRITLQTDDGATLAIRRWEPQGRSRSSVILVHGLADHSGRFGHVGRALAERGHTVTAADLRGHGESSGHRGHVERFARFFDDLDVVISQRPAPEAPLVLMGHSFGGLVALASVLDGRTTPELLVLSAPALAADIPAVKKALARVLGAIAPRFRIANDFDGGLLARNPAIGEAYFADPLVLDKTTARLGRESLATMSRVRARLDRLTVPTLVIHGGDDRLVPPQASESLAGIPGVERIVFEGFRHESFNEDGGGEAIGVVADWLDRQLEDAARS